jgi:hypothetical protein
MGAFHQGDYVGAVVADIGAYSTKIGWAGDDYPKSYFRSVSACASHDSERLGGVHGKAYCILILFLLYLPFLYGRMLLPSARKRLVIPNNAEVPLPK